MLDRPILQLLIVSVLLGIPALVVAAGGAAKTWRTRSRGRSTGTMQMTCTVCERPLVFARTALDPLSPQEIALAVRAHPAIVGRKLGEYVCPYCEAAHCFTTDGPRLSWIGVNLYEPQTLSAHCFECRKKLERPPGGPGAKLADLSRTSADFGLECPHCKSVCCVACCNNATRNRTKDGTLLCPRCFRRPMERLFYP